ncbi:MAG: hypothetical protein QFB87_05045 [Patescibacteria group bacterium]|nr:hypothetical protein [Patescibacteria group bacterium]
MTNDELRVKFEEWANNSFELSLKRHEVGAKVYIDFTTHASWLAYQAAHAEFMESLEVVYATKQGNILDMYGNSIEPDKLYVIKE